MNISVIIMTETRRKACHDWERHGDWAVQDELAACIRNAGEAVGGLADRVTEEKHLACSPGDMHSNPQRDTSIYKRPQDGPNPPM